MKNALTEVLNKAHALIFTSYCTKTMQFRIEEHPKFSTRIKSDPIDLLEVIKTLMPDSVWTQWPLVSMTNALARVVNLKQIEKENILDDVKRFKQLRDVATNQLGRGFLHKFV